VYILFFTLFLSSSPSPALTSNTVEFLSEPSCAAAATKLAKELKSAYAEHLPRVTAVCVPK